MKESNDDFLEHIKSTLRNHEEPYEEGAWENFSRIQKPSVKKGRMIAIWKWAVAAATILGGVFLTIKFTGNKNAELIPAANIAKAITADSLLPKQPANELAMNNQIDSIHSKNSSANTVKNNNESPINKGFRSSILPALETNQNKNITVPTEHKKNESLPSNNIVVNSNPSNKETRQEESGINNITNQKTNTTVKSNPLPESENKIARNTQPTLPGKTNKESLKKWQPGLYVSPVFSDQGMNMGYGVSLAYNINDRLKIRSGIAHTKVSASHFYDEPSQASNAPTLAENRTTLSRSVLNDIVGTQQTTILQNVVGSLSGLDIPLELSYSLNKKWYTSAGLSGLIVLNDKKTYTYKDSRNVKVSVETNKGSVKEDKSLQISNSYSTKNTMFQPSNEATPFLGYYNLSLGFKQNIFNKNSVAIEPFLKIPMNKTPQQNLNYSATGIRLRFDF